MYKKHVESSNEVYFLIIFSVGDQIFHICLNVAKISLIWGRNCLPEICRNRDMKNSLNIIKFHRIHFNTS